MVESEKKTPAVADYELLKTPEETLDQPPPRRIGVWVVSLVVLVAAAIAVYVAFGRRQPPASAPAPVAQESSAPPPAAQSLGAEAEPIAVPPLDQTDPLVREMVTQISANPRVAAWLATNGLIRNFAVVVENVAGGMSPAVHLRTLRPSTSFQVTRSGNRLVIDPRSYQRYDSLAAAAASIDPAGAARLYATLKPRIEEAYRDVSNPSARFDRTLERAIVLLLKTPAVPDPIPVRLQGGTGYAFADPNLEALAPSQKQLLRTGAVNVRSIQASLRAIALAMGIPADRLPPPAR
jgi:hypothetical protein